MNIELLKRIKEKEFAVYRSNATKPFVVNEKKESCIVITDFSPHHSLDGELDYLSDKYEVVIVYLDSEHSRDLESIRYVANSFPNVVVQYEGTIMPGRLSNLFAAKSDLGQDIWVLEQSLLKPCNNTYLEIGAAHPVNGNNTFLLEQRGWKGISYDPLLCEDTWSRTRENPYYKIAVNSDGSRREFSVCNTNNLSGFSANITDLWQDYVSKNTIEKVMIECISIKDVLAYFDDKHITFLSLDTEGSEYEILSAIPFDEYTIDFITVEHNHQEPSRTQMKKLLEKNGYRRCEEVQCDDWYVKI